MFKESTYKVTYLENGILNHSNPKYIKNVRKLMLTKDVLGVWRKVTTKRKNLISKIYSKDVN
jgi:hypothetical protein